MQKKPLLIGTFIITAIGAFYAFDLDRFVTFENLLTWHLDAAQWAHARPIVASLAYVTFYALFTSLSLPGTLIITLAGGAIFGLLWGIFLVSFASSIGATIAFLISRTLLRNWVYKRFGERLETINDGLERDGKFYLFTLRMIPAIPFFVINLVFGLTSMKTWSFYWVSQLGMLAATSVFVYAGTQLAQIDNARDIASPGVLLALTALGFLPLTARKIIEYLRRAKIKSQSPSP